MSRDPSRPASTYRDRGREWDLRDSRSRSDYRSRPDYDRDHNVSRKRSRTPNRHRSGAMHSNESDDILSKPKELWDNNQFQEADFGAPPPPSYQEGSNYGPNFQPPYSGLYNEFPTLSSIPPAAPPPPTDIMTWNQMSIPPAAVAPPQYNVEDQIKKEAAIESEMRQQKAALSKQREDYKKKVLVLKKELETLKDQRDELRGDPKRSPSPDTKRFLKENTKLQLEIQNKLKTIDNVVDMLNGIIGQDGKTETLGTDTEPIERSERASKRKSRSPTLSTKFNYVYYDPEMHWCRVCNEFPSTAKDYLNHLHSATHTKLAAAHMEAPWHSVNGINEGYPSNPNAPNKRIPIKGLQFFVPSTAWYCKLCDQFIGDLHCASAHLKSVTHSKNYMNFVEQNPHWETDWVSDRQKAFEKNRPSKGKAEEKPQYTAHTITFSKDGFHTKSKHSLTPSPDNKRKKDKKKKNKKKRESSSSSSYSSTDSEKPKKKMVKAKKDNAKIEDLMSAIKMDRLNDSDRQLLHNIKNSLKHEDNKRRSNEERERERDREKEREMEKERERDRERERALRDRDRPREPPRKRQLESTRRTPPQRLEVKTDFRKMPFIGKMPVYRNLSKAKSSEQRKEEERRREEEEEAERRKREEMDAEIQRKVAEFKQRIARGAEHPQTDLPPPALAHPTELGTSVVIHSQATQPQPQPQTTPQPLPQQQSSAPSLPKDFQEALDIIFPSETKSEPQPAPVDMLHMYPVVAMGAVGAVGAAGRVLPPYPPFLQPPTQPIFGFDVPHVYPSHHQLYDSQPQHQQQQQHQQQPQHQQQHQQQPQHQQPRKPAKKDKKVPSQGNGNVQKKQEELDEMALLGIDASDVGAM